MPVLRRAKRLLEDLLSPRSGLVEGYIILLDPTDRGVTPNVAKGTYEPEETEFVKANLKPGDTFVDIGANIGYFSVLAALQGAEVFAFEPASRPRSYLKDNLYGFRALIYPIALSDVGGYEDLYLNSWNRGDNRLYKTEGMEVERVPVMRLDDVIHKADFIKIDTQGWEVHVLRGATRILQDHPTLMIECWPLGLSRTGSRWEELVKVIEEAGYQWHALGTHPRHLAGREFTTLVATTKTPRS